MNNQQHEMILTKVYPSGAEEWFCPECGRRFIMQWPPVYKKVILNVGDENAIHSGGRGGVYGGPDSGENGSVSNRLDERHQNNDYTYDSNQDPSGFRQGSADSDLAGSHPAGYDSRSLEPWLEWMERVNFENLWKE